MTLNECRAAIGQRVIYASDRDREEGTIASVNQRYVFVIYDGDRSPKATDPADLRPADSMEWPKR